MRVVLPTAQAGSEADVHAHYAANWLQHGGIRADFVSSADGAATAGGASRGLQTPGDNRVFAALRDLADVVLVGAGTARTEGYGAVRPAGEALRQRRAHGLPAALRIAVVSQRLDLDPNSSLFATDPDNRTLVITSASAPSDALDRLRPVAEVISCGADAIDLAAAVTALRDRGLRRILAEGGPTLFGALVTAGLVDELCLSLTPMLIGPGPRRIVGGPAWPQPRRLSLVGLLEEDGAMFCRYRLTTGA